MFRCSHTVKLLNIEEYPNIMLTLTCCYCSPTHIPTSACTTAISAEVYPDHVAYACDGGRQGGAAPLLHQGGSVTVTDGQVVAATCGTGLNIKCCEFQCHNQSLIHFYYIGPLNIVGIVIWIIWRSEHACNKKRVRIALSSPLTLRATAVIRARK